MEVPYKLLFFFLLTTGCVSSFQFDPPSSANEKMKFFFQESELEVIDDQFSYNKSDTLLKEDISYFLKVSPSSTPIRSLKFHFEKCVLEKGFYENPKTFLSIITITFIPAGNIYLCRTSLTVTEKSGIVKKFYVDQRNIISFGLIETFGLGTFNFKRFKKMKMGIAQSMMSAIANHD